MFATLNSIQGFEPLQGLTFPSGVPDFGLSRSLALQRLGSGPWQGLTDSSALQLLTLSQQTTQLILNMMSLLVGLMGNQAPPSGLESSKLPTMDSFGGLGPLEGGSGSSKNSQASYSNAGSSSAGSSPKVQKLIDAALSKQGTPYVFGAAGPNKFDCSGLVSWALHQAGAKGGRTTARGLQARYASSKVSKADLKPGDLVFLWYPNNRGIPRGQASHVEIYLGNGKTMGTDSPKERAKVEPIDWSAFIGGARPPELQQQ